MKISNGLLVIALVTGSFALQPNSGMAGTGKIYVAGKWVEAASDTNSQAFNPAISTGVFGFQNPSQDFRALVHKFLADNAAVLATSLNSAWIDQSVQKGVALETHRLKKLWNGIEVMGGEALVHLKQGRVLFANADGTSLNGLSSSPRLAAEEAREIAFSSYRGTALLAAQPELKILILGQGSAKDAKLVYSVNVLDSDGISSDTHFIDAQTGNEAMVTSNVQTLVDRKVVSALGSSDDFKVITADNANDQIDHSFPALYSDKGCSAPSEGISILDSWKNLLGRKKQSAAITSGPQSCASADPTVMTSALAAWNNSGLVYDYYLGVHQRDSVDGNGLLIRSIVNFGGAKFKNAAWYNNLKVMLYGIGDNDRFNDFASPLDVVAHELTHGVTASTAALLYSAESGALNESYSDVFGKLVSFKNGKPADWKIGTELFRDGTSYIRNMESPLVGHTKDFKYRNQDCNRFNDFCGVHDNSGIPSKAAVAIAKQLGLDRFAKLYYLTLTQLLRSSSDFSEAKAQTVAACATLFGRGNADCEAVSNAFTSVGI